MTLDPRAARPGSAPSSSTVQPTIAEVLARIEARLSAIEAKVDSVMKTSAMVPGAVATVTDTVDGAIQAMQQRGIDVDDRARALLALLERMTQPQTLRALESLVALGESAPHAIATITDTIDGLALRAQEQGLDLDERLRLLLAAGERLTSPEALEALQLMLGRVDALQNVLRSGLLDAPSVAVVANAGKAIARVASEQPTQMGAFALVRALTDPDVQRSLSLVVRFAQRFGAELGGDRPVTALPSKT
jgi:uncharacterized protein YjgD (DUF1641 family)